LATQQSIKAYADSILTPSVVTVANTDRIVITDASDGGIIKAGTQFGTGTTTFLRNDGTWAIPSGGDTHWPLNDTVMQNESGNLGIKMSLWDGLFLRLTTAMSGNITGLYNALKLAANSVDSTNIVDGSIADVDIANSSNWATAYDERGSQIAGNSLTWDGSELDVDDDFVKLIGDEMSGDLLMGGNDILNTSFVSLVDDTGTLVGSITTNATTIVISGPTTDFELW